MNAVQYTNRKGDTYFLQAGTTRTGKPRYWFGRKQTGEPVEAVPPGYEIYEHPKEGLVSLRKVKPSPISQLDRDILSNGIRRFAGLEHFIVDVDGESLVVYLPGIDEAEADRTLEMLAGPQSVLSPRLLAVKTAMIQQSGFMKMMRFTLVNPDERVFVVQRWCFLGDVDDWIWVGGPDSLEELVRTYGKHLGKESFYEMM